MEKPQEFLKDDLAALDKVISQFLEQTNVPLIPKVGHHLLKAGGKRLRPLLTLMCSKLFQTSPEERVLRLGACIEFIHSATLLHDDVVDQSNERRGKPSAHTLWGNNASILVGDFLFTKAFELMVGDGDIAVFETLSKTASQIAEGELMQLTHLHDLAVSEQIYMDIITAKTASLFSAACELGGLAANASPGERALLKTIGLNMGILFQISDDILDFGLEGNTLGKAAGNDLIEGKMTLPLILAYKYGDPQQKQYIETALKAESLESNTLATIQGILKETQSIEKSLAFALPFQERALQSLEKFGQNTVTKHLEEIIKFSLNRCNAP